MLTNDFLHGIRPEERIGCRILWITSYVVCLPVAAVGRLTGWRWMSWTPERNGSRSIVKEASSMARYIVGCTYSAH